MRTAAPHGTIPVCWSAGDFERDWIHRLLLRHIPHRIVRTDMKRDRPPARKHVLVYDRQHEEGLFGFLRERLDVIIVHLGDEWGRCSMPYWGCPAVFRSYHISGLAPNVRVIPLGLGRGFSASGARPASRRRHFWSFVGQLESKPAREALVASLKKYPGGLLYLTHRWNDPDALAPRDYAAILEDSVFVAAAGGWAAAPETFRLFEALEAGAIPVVPDRDMAYYQAAYGKVPFVTASTDLRRVDRDAVQAACRAWWARQEAAHAKAFVSAVHRHFGDLA